LCIITLGIILCLSIVKPVTADEALEDGLAATSRITDRVSSGTCFLVSARGTRGPENVKAVLITTAHALEGMTGSECQLILRTLKSDRSFTRKEVAVPIRTDNKPRWKRHPDHDIAALPVELPAGVAVKPFLTQQLADEKSLTDRKIRVGQEVWIPCYPSNLEANEAGWAILRKGAIATYPLTPLRVAKTLLIDFSVFGGESGAPVVAISEGKPLVVGMVVGMHRQTSRSSTPFEDRTTHTPLGLAIVVQAAFVRETLDLLGK
jgi:hypothetical protein